MKMMLCIALGHEQCGSSLSACGKVWSILVAVIHCGWLACIYYYFGILMSWCRLGPNQC